MMIQGQLSAGDWCERQDLNFYNNQRVCLIWDIVIHYNVLATSGILEPVLTWGQKNCNRPECVPRMPPLTSVTHL